MTAPRTYTTTWRDLLRHLVATGEPMTVWGHGDWLDTDLEWIATPAGLNRYDADGQNCHTWQPDANDVLTTPVPVPAATSLRAVGVEALTPPVEAYQTVAADQARRWAYTETLDTDELAEFIRQLVLDPNLRADVEAVWRYAARHFVGRAGGRPL